MKALVTGATGLVGHRLVGVLKDAGHEVTALVRDLDRAERLLDDVKLVRGDTTDRRSIDKAVRGADVVFHVAGMPQQFLRDERVFDQVNRGGTRNVLEAALAAGVKRAVYTSTVDIFAAEPNGTLVETRLESAPKPTAYERSKQAADREAERIRREGLEVVHVCPSAIYGPSPVNAVLNTFFIKLLKRESPVLPPGGLSYVFVDGCAEAHLAAAEVGVSGERYLLADGHATVAELAREILAQSVIRKIPPTAPLWLLKAVAIAGEALAQRIDVTPLIARGQLTFMEWNVHVDVTKARRDLGFTPFGLAEGVALTTAHLRKEGLVP